MDTPNRSTSSRASGPNPHPNPLPQAGEGTKGSLPQGEGGNRWHRIADKLRASPLLIVFLIAFAATAALNPAKVGLIIWGIAKLGAGGYIGYWIDRLLYPYARPHALEGIAQGAAAKRRALIVAASVIAVALVP